MVAPKTGGILKRNNCVYTQIVKHCLADKLLPIIQNLSDMNKTEFYSDCFAAYDGLVDFLFRFACNYKQNGLANHRLAKFRGIKKENFLDSFERNRI
ncbi:hypothetical protein [Helicobacter sp. T3_23-1059]